MAHHPARPGTFLAGIVIAVVGISCAEAPTSSVPAGRSSSATPVPPETFTVTCTADGGTEVSAAQVEADSDGVHVHVVNRSGEPASLNGLGPDVDPGPSDIVASTPPGSVEVACWPFSGHSGPEPKTIPLEVVDPNAYYRVGELECEGDVTWSQVNDYIVGANGTSGNPVDIAHDVVKGLEPTDEIVGVGYPDREDAASVAIVREGSTIAIASFERASDGGWLLGGGQGCDASGIRF